MNVASRHIDRQSFNVGWSFPELDLPDRIVAAGRAGFRLVECHSPYDWPIEVLRDALAESGTELLCLNVPTGEQGFLGHAAVEGAEAAFEAGIAKALNYAVALKAPMIHVLAGIADPTPDAEARFVANLRSASIAAAAHEVTLLIEPLNSFDEPGYFLSDIDQAAQLLGRISQPNVKLMFDCYHVGIERADVLALLREHMGSIGHVQIAAVPSHAEPDDGTVDYRTVYDLLDSSGYRGAVGIEYVPRAETAAGFGWMDRLGIVGGDLSQ